ncbi:MAG: agmatinase family protein [Phycisphaerales bacterium]|nr:agmatinase family protein [Phycisphaerales bacterium]
MSFDADAAAAPGSGIFGLPFTREQARVVLLPVAFDATTSYRPGTADGPGAVRRASMQVDLYDRAFGRVYEQGIYMEEEDPAVRQLSKDAAEAARPVIETGGAEPDNLRHEKALTIVAKACERLNEFVYDHTRGVLEDGKIPGLVGGEHSVPFGAIRAIAEAHPGVGILHIDAHMDLREAFEGFMWSHASIMHNVITRIEGVAKLVQVGIRDFGERELAMAKEHKDRIKVYFDEDIAWERERGGDYADLCRKIIRKLPEKVYISFDIDGLDPKLCPHTGTPVPGGLSFHQAAWLLEMLRESGKQVVGFDLVEVAPGPDNEPEWDANVGARVLYKLCGAAGPE